MTNMHYCRFHNTLVDLEQILEDIEDVDSLDEYEREARIEVLKRCADILETVGKEVGCKVVYI